MAWEEQRRMRDPAGSRTRRRLPVCRPHRPMARRPEPAGDRVSPVAEHWGRRFGWMLAVGLSVTALLVSVIALATAGPSDAGFRHDGRGMFGGPGSGYGNRSGTQNPQQSQPVFPGGQGYGLR